MAQSDEPSLILVALGGLGEIGMNCMVLEFQDSVVLIDCGIQFPDAEFPGIDLFLPDFSLIREKFGNVKGIVVTHGHDDHIGAIPFLLQEYELDVFCTPFPMGLIKGKLLETERTKEVRFHEIKPRQLFQVGPFIFDPIPVQHSIIESLALAIKTPVGNIIHTGDFKHDSAEWGGQTIGLGAFEEWGKQGVELLLSDSTNAERAGHTLSETDITMSFEKIFRKQTGRIIVALFASNIRRIENLLHTARKLGKHVALAGRSMHSYTKLAHEQGSLNIPEDTLVLLENIGDFPDNKLIVLATGSQAESQSALVRIAQGLNKDFVIKQGDLVLLSSRFIPGNERAITKMIDQLYRLGSEVLYESIQQIHVSGHGFQDELRMMIKAVRPRHFIPIHGEYRHLAKHAALARECGVPSKKVFVIEDGQGIEVSSSGVSLGAPLVLSKIPVADGIQITADPAAFSKRSKLSRGGVVFVVVIHSSTTGKLLMEPRVSGYGLLFRKGYDREEVMKSSVEFLNEFCQLHRGGDDFQEAVRIELRRFFKKRLNQKPEVYPLIIDI